MGRPSVRTQLGVFFAALAWYALTAPGRIDMIDGQLRFDVARTWWLSGLPLVADPYLPSVPGVDGGYAFYGPLASLVGMPWVALAEALGGGPGAQMFWYSLAIVPIASLALVLLHREWRLDGVPHERALAATALFAVGTPWWLYASSTFDQALHGSLLLGVFLAARRAARHDSPGWAAAAGALHGTILLGQETFVVLTPIAVGMLRRDGESLLGLLRSRRAWVFALVAGAGLIPVLGYNAWRFGSPFQSGKESVGHPVVGNPLWGLAGLLVSPGKSILLYSPLTLVALVGWGAALARVGATALGAVGYALAHLGLISCLAFWGGEWAWGPRYLVYTLPIVLYALPWGMERLGRGRMVALGVVAIGVQALGVSMDHQAWFFAHGFTDYFWVDPTTAWTHSALLDRPGELARIAFTRAEDSFAFAPGPRPQYPTYCIFGFPDEGRTPEALTPFPVFHLPRPWPLWFPWVDPATLPVDPRPVLAGLSGLLIAGLLLLRPQRDPR